MSETSIAENDPLTGWDPRRRAALADLWQRFREAGAADLNLGDELIAERRQAAAAEDHDEHSDE